MAWIPWHLDDLTSDLSAVHGIRDMGRLTGAGLCKLAWRLTAYPSVTQFRATDSSNGNSGRTTVPGAGAAAARAAIAADPNMARVFSFGSKQGDGAGR